MVERGPCGRRLKQPFTYEIPDDESESERRLRQYVFDAFVAEYPKLVRFTLENSSMKALAEHLLRHRTGSLNTLRSYVCHIHRFSKWLQKEPDQFLNECKRKDQVPIPKVVVQTRRLLGEFLDNLQEENGLAPHTVYHTEGDIRVFFKLNGIHLGMPYRRSKWSIYEIRAPTPEEVQKTIGAADLRGKAIIALLALGGFRSGTLVELKYRHVKHDIEHGTIPIHVHVEAKITKGKRFDYDTFLNREAAEYLKTYLDARQKGVFRGPPERLEDESPLISEYFHIIPLARSTIRTIVSNYYVKAGVLPRKPKNKQHELNVRSLRRFFMTQMMSTGTERDYVEYMMGHSLTGYHDVKMKGVDFLRGIYLKSGISIQPRTKTRKIMDLVDIARSWELDPQEILTQEALNYTRTTRTIAP
jgi:integrase